MTRQQSTERGRSAPWFKAIVERFSTRCLLAGVASAIVFVTPVFAQPAADASSAERGKYLFHAGGCQGCHTDEKNKGALLAGGRALKTPFGTFYGPNITPDPVHGIGKWSDADFIRALKEGVSPQGAHYYPVLPYTSYTKMSEQDMRDIKAYIFTLPAVAKPSTPHELGFPFNMRWGLGIWKLLNFKPGALPAEPTRDAEWQRGRYLSEALGHCAECHTPRNFIGALVTNRWMGGSPEGAEGEPTPNITPDEKTGIGEWGADEIAFALKIGMKPDGDSLGSSMAEVIQNSTSHLSDEDLAAIAAYLKSLPAVESAAKAAP